jgi:hypothetical protein
MRMTVDAILTHRRLRITPRRSSGAATTGDRRSRTQSNKPNHRNHCHKQQHQAARN